MTTGTRGRTAGGIDAPSRWTVVWLGIAAVVYVASVVDLVDSAVPPVSIVSGVGLTLVMLVAGTIIVLRTEVPLLGWLLVAVGATINSFSAIDNGVGANGIEALTDAQLVWLSVIGVSPAALLAAIILFPTGRAANRITQVVLVGGVGTQVLAHGLQVAAALDLIGGDWATWRGIADTGVAVTVFAALLLHVVTYRRRPRTEQLQVKYLILALLFGALSFFVNSGGALTLVEGVPSQVGTLLDILGPGLIPVAIMLAMTRYRLYEIDRFISRTVAYSLVLGLLALVFVGGVTGVTALVPTQDRLAVALTTVAAVALFDPLRRRVTTAVDRRFDRTRYVAHQVVEGFGRDVQDITDVDEIGDRVHAVIGRTVAPTTVAVWQPSDGGPS